MLAETKDVDPITNIHVQKAHFSSIPKGKGNHQREQQALISHGALKLFMLLVKSDLKILRRRGLFAALPQKKTYCILYYVRDRTQC